MEFTEIQQLNQLIQINRTEDKNRLEQKRNEEKQIEINIEANQIINNVLSVKQASLSIVQDLEQYAMSYYSALQKKQEMQSPHIEIKREEIEFNQSLAFNVSEIQQAKISFSRKKTDFTQRQRSSLLAGRLSQVILSKHHTFQKKIYKLKIYYFGTASYKIIEYNADTLVQIIIKKALSAYLLDTSLDQTKITSVNKQGYHLFMCDDGSHFPDPDLDAINSKRKIKDINVDIVVLMRNQLVPDDSANIIAEYIAVDIYNIKSIVIVNEFGQQILKNNINADSVIAPIYEKIQKIATKYQEDRFYLAVSQQSTQEEAINKDVKVSDLPNALYIRLRRYADEAIIPLRHMSDQIEIEDIEAPMSIAQASMYQQFAVFKINKRGVRQHRILGIDQVKIYNYDFEIRQQDKQVSFFNKMFGNVNETFGTKTPERLISDIVNVKQISQSNMLIIEFSNLFSSKSLQFEIQPKIRRKIMQKLRVLTNNHR